MPREQRHTADEKGLSYRPFFAQPHGATLEQLHIQNRERIPLPEGVITNTPQKRLGDGKDNYPVARYGLTAMLKIHEYPGREAIRNDLFEAEYYPGPFYAMIDFALAKEIDRNVILNTAGLIAREIVLRFALLIEYQQTHDVVLHRLNAYQKMAEDRKRDELGPAASYLKLSVESLNLEESISGYKAAVDTAWRELSRVETEVLQLADDAERIGVIQVWDSAMGPLAIKDLKAGQRPKLDQK